MNDMTITAVRTIMLRVPWPQTPWLKGHAFGDARNFLVVDDETKGGIARMGYLCLFRPGIRSIIACLDEVIIPRVIGKDASAVEAIWQDLWKTTITFGRGGIATMAMSALDIALTKRGYTRLETTVVVPERGELTVPMLKLEKDREPEPVKPPAPPEPDAAAVPPPEKAASSVGSSPSALSTRLPLTP